MIQRLQKILAEAGVASRRASEGLITSGAVTVNGETITTLGTKADDEKDDIRVNGKPIKKTAGEKKTYILLNKPAGYACTRSDPHAKHTVLDLVPGGKYLYPVGRLDMNTSGLIILTDDGDFTHLMTRPSFGVDKTYLAVVEGRVSPTKLNSLCKGVRYDGGVSAPATAHMVRYSQKNDESTVEITIHEGKKRQVRRMFEVVGNPVVDLKRIRFGCLDLEGVEEGKYRRLTAREVKELMRLAGK